MHWLLLTVAAAAIVTRSLAPLKQLLFSPDCVLTERDLQVRIMLLRPTVVRLQRACIGCLFSMLRLRFRDYVCGSMCLSSLRALLPTQQVLHNLEIKLEVSNTRGQHYSLPLRNGIDGYAYWLGSFPMTVVHNIDESSPLFPGRSDFGAIAMVRLYYIAWRKRLGGRSSFQSRVL